MDLPVLNISLIVLKFSFQIQNDLYTLTPFGT